MTAHLNALLCEGGLLASGMRLPHTLKITLSSSSSCSNLPAPPPVPSLLLLLLLLLAPNEHFPRTCTAGTVVLTPVRCSLAGVDTTLLKLYHIP